MRRWEAAGLDAGRLEALRRAEVRVADLAGPYLGFAFADEHAIQIDADAAGYGWFVDGTPWEDSEFTLPGDQGEQGRVDLLSTVAHELGHLLGLADLSGAGHAGDLMGEALTTGLRRLPTAAEVAAATGAGAVFPDTNSRPIAPVIPSGRTQPDSISSAAVYWHPDPAAAPIPADPTPPPPRVTERVPVTAAVEGPPVAGLAVSDAPPLLRESPDEWGTSLTDGGVGTFWAIDLGDLP